MRISTRPATEKDATFVYALTEVCMREYAEHAWGQWFEDAVRASFKPLISRIIQCDGPAIGCLEVEERPSSLVLGKLYIAPSHQNRGIGTLFVRQLIDRATRQEKSIRLSVLKSNPARRLYERFGFAEVSADEQGFILEWRQQPCP